MNQADARELMRSVLRPIAPEADIDTVGTHETLQEALDLDSIDFLEFVTGLAAATGREIPESDYAQLSTVEGCVGYLTSP
ncbi:MAG: acyl carrier protein [Acidobacteriota bacterium]|nr:acyl carrier protein [Acidobacteriota bacterium]